MEFSALFFITALITAVLAVPGAVGPGTVDKPTGPIISEAQFAHWLETTDAELTFIGDRPDFTPLARRSSQNNIMVTLCSQRVGNVCGGSCTVFSGTGPSCVDIPRSQCISATDDIGYCDERACDGNCNELADCGTMLNNGFCFTFDTKSIVLPIEIQL
ncbi:hypothetical protein BV20DRAFT_1050542 [Pilatotrama ljubarskyi]|nr:hypothetical protein BV20DRAFT_1050542 [Pilatotrama ljubarskyi]